MSKAPIDFTEATDLVKDLRKNLILSATASAGPTMLVGGATAQFVDLLLFGLSMDYEVFLMGRIREQWLLTHDNDDAVATGVAHTARPITAAAAIMASPFGCFLVADVLELKEFGFGFALAVAVILDATVVRLLLVPAIMKVAGGKANWWLPKFLRRILPEVRLA